MSILDLLTNSDGELKRALSDYSILALPHVGRGADLTPDQRRDNLDAVLAQKTERISGLTAFVGQFGITLPSPGAEGFDARAVSTALDALAKRRFTKVRAFETACKFDWRRTPVTGIEAAARAVAIDLGIYIGECATFGSEPFDWRIGESRYRPANMPMTAGEVVISKMSTIGPKPLRIYLDVIDWSVFAVWDILRHRRHKAAWKINHFEYLEHLLDNRY